MKVSIFGLGYVGTVAAGCLAKDGHDVKGVDPNEEKVGLINAGRTPIIEDEIDVIIAESVSAGRLEACSDSASALFNSDVSLVCVGTPSNSNGSLDLTYVRSVCEEIGDVIRRKDSRHTVVMRSTMLPGSMRNVVIPTLEKSSGKTAGTDFGVCINPEFLREGTAVYDYYHPPKTVIGEIDAESGDILCELYSALDAPLVRTSVELAEMVKYIDNIWHALKVGFANEVGSLSKALELDGQRVMEIFCKDEKLNLSATYLRPGFSFGGSCLPKDLRAMNYKASRMDVDAPIMRAILPSNSLHIERALAAIREMNSKKIGILGFSFKAGTDDLRESPVVELVEKLLGKGYDLKLYDRQVNLASLVGANKNYILNHISHISAIMADSLEDVLRFAEIIVIGNGSDEFRSVMNKLKPHQRVLDLVGIAKPENPSERYQGIGW